MGNEIWRKAIRVGIAAAAVYASGRSTPPLLADSYSTRGLPQRIFSSGLLSANNTVANQTMFTPTTVGAYRISCFSLLSNNVAGASGAWNISFHAISSNGFGFGQTSSNQNLNATNGTTNIVGPTYFISNNNNAITYNLTFTAPTGAPTVVYSCTLEQL